MMTTRLMSEMEIVGIAGESEDEQMSSKILFVYQFT